MNNPRPERQQILRGILLVSIAVLMFAIMDAMSKYLTRFYPVTYIVWVRFFVHTVLLVAILCPRLGLRFLRTSRPGIHALRGVLLPFSAVCFVLATKYMPIAEASAITFVGPLVVTMLAVVFRARAQVSPYCYPWVLPVADGASDGSNGKTPCTSSTASDGTASSSFA